MGRKTIEQLHPALRRVNISDQARRGFSLTYVPEPQRWEIRAQDLPEEHTWVTIHESRDAITAHQIFSDLVFFQDITAVREAHSDSEYFGHRWVNLEWLLQIEAEAL